MSNILKIILPFHLDETKITDYLLAGTDIEIEVENTYAVGISLSNTVSINDFTTDEKAALFLLLDKMTYAYEAGTYIFRVIKEEKTFSLSESFERDSEIIPKPGTQIPDGTTLMCRFEIPGFDENTAREIPLYFNSAFDPADLDALAEIGISLTGDGMEFTVSNATDCKISFSMPEASEIPYIIDFQQQPEIIPADD